MSNSRKTRAAAGAVLWTGLAVAALSAAGCGTLRQTFSNEKVTPDEFRVVTKAPLVVPPEFALRPPAPGEPRPQELAPESQARQVLLGAREAAQRDDAEKLLVAKAGAERADPLVRYVVDDEFGSIAHKEKSFAEKVMFWRKGEPAVAPQVAQAEAAANTPAPLNAAAVQARIRSLTGDQQIIIQRAPPKNKKKRKLPGL